MLFCCMCVYSVVVQSVSYYTLVYIRHDTLTHNTALNTKQNVLNVLDALYLSNVCVLKSERVYKYVRV